MIARLIRWSIGNRFLVLLAMAKIRALESEAAFTWLNL